MLSLGFRLTATGQAADEDGMVLFLPPPAPCSLKNINKKATAARQHLTLPSLSLSFPLENNEIPAPLDPQAPEVGPENWQALLDGAYAFRYARAEAEAESKSASTSKEQTREQTGQREEEKPARFMLVRASTAGDALAVAWCKEGSGGDASSSPAVPVASIVLPFGDWLASPSGAAAPRSSSSSSPTSSSRGDPTARFRDLSKLEAHLKDALERGVGLEGEKKKKEKKEEEEGEEGEQGAEGGAASGGGGPAARPEQQEQPDHYPRPPPPHPVPSIGADDLYPPGLGPGMPGIAHPFPGGFPGGGGGFGGGGSPGGGGGFPGGGGSQVGPDHPLFGGRHPGIRPPGGFGGGRGVPPVPGLPPGARWDPIGPPGTPGFLPPPPPDQGRGRGRGGGPPSFHPDIMPPGPGGPFGGGSGAGGFGGGFV